MVQTEQGNVSLRNCRAELLEEGYAVFPKVVPDDLVAAVVRDIEVHTKEGRLATNNGGLVEMYHYQSMWDVRQHPEVYKQFYKLFDGRKDLWVSIDRACYKKPCDKGYGPKPSEDGFVHWDVNVNRKPRPFEVQGLIALTDCGEGEGGFHCLPELYKGPDRWLDGLPTGKAFYSSFGYERYENEWGKGAWAVEWQAEGYSYGREPYRWLVKAIPLQAGDLLVWHSCLPHGSAPNLGDKPRLCQYVTMFPPKPEEKEERLWCWERCRPPSGWAFPGDPRNLERGEAELTTLGERLLGVASWGQP
jgi:hypothetical protein